MELEHPQWYIPDAENEHECELRRHWDCHGESSRLLAVWINERENAGNRNGKEASECFRLYETQVGGGEREPPQGGDGGAGRCREEGGGLQRGEEDGERGDPRREESGVEEEYETNREDVTAQEREEDREDETRDGVNGKERDEEEGDEKRNDTGGGGERGDKEEEEELGDKVKEEEVDERMEVECSMHQEKESEEGKEVEEEEERNGESERKEEKCSVLEDRENFEQVNMKEGEKCEVQNGERKEEDKVNRGEKYEGLNGERVEEENRERDEENREREEKFWVERDTRERHEGCDQRVDREKKKERDKERGQEGEEEEKEEECNGGLEGWCECPECHRRPVLYCLDELQPLCWACGLSERHDGHNVCPPEQALKDCRVEVGVAMQPMFQSFKNLTKAKLTYNQMAEHIPRQSAETREQIRDQFEELRQFLRAEEEARIATVRKEQERKASTLRERAERMRGEMRRLLHALKSSQMEMEAQGEDGLHFLQNYKRTVKRVWKANQGPEKSYDSLIDVPKHVGNLRFRVWEKMKDICPFTSVTLDPNTASPFLHVSNNLTSVRDSGVDIDADGNIPVTSPNGHLPDNPERFACCGEMLGREVITTSLPKCQSRRNSGLGFRRRQLEMQSDRATSTSWVVDVGENNNWMLGVARSSVNRKSLLAACPNNGCWALSLRGGRYEALESPAVPLPLAPSDCFRKGGLASGPRRVRVRVNHGSGRVCFTDAERHTHLYTFSQAAAAANQTLQPYFSTACQHRSLRVLPSPVAVTFSRPGPGGKDEDEEEEEEERLSTRV